MLLRVRGLSLGNSDSGDLGCTVLTRTSCLSSGKFELLTVSSSLRTCSSSHPFHWIHLSGFSFQGVLLSSFLPPSWRTHSSVTVAQGTSPQPPWIAVSLRQGSSLWLPLSAPWSQALPLPPPGGLRGRVPGPGTQRHPHLHRAQQSELCAAGSGLQPGFPEEPQGWRAGGWQEFSLP